jgi:hypothetical protein
MQILPLLSKRKGIHLLIQQANATREELALWIDHFLLPGQLSALHIKRVGSVTYLEMAALISAKSHAVQSSIKRKQRELDALQKKALEKEEQVFKLFM